MEPSSFFHFGGVRRILSPASLPVSFWTLFFHSFAYVTTSGILTLFFGILTLSFSARREVAFFRDATLKRKHFVRCTDRRHTYSLIYNCPSLLIILQVLPHRSVRTAFCHHEISRHRFQYGFRPSPTLFIVFFSFFSFFFILFSNDSLSSLAAVQEYIGVDEFPDQTMAFKL